MDALTLAAVLSKGGPQGNHGISVEELVREGGTEQHCSPRSLAHPQQPPLRLQRRLQCTHTHASQDGSRGRSHWRAASAWFTCTSVQCSRFGGQFVIARGEGKECFPVLASFVIMKKDSRHTQRKRSTVLFIIYLSPRFDSYNSSPAFALSVIFI